MKIMLVNDCPVGLPGSGGVEGHVAQLAEALRQAGHEAFILAHQLRGKPEARNDETLLLPWFNAPPLCKHFLRNRALYRRALEKATEFIRDVNPDVIHVHNLMKPGSLERLRQLRPSVKSIHDCRPFCTKPYPVVASRLIGSGSRFCDITFCGRCWWRCYACAGASWRERIEGWTYYPPNRAALDQVRCDIPDERIRLIHHFTDMEQAACPTTAVADGPEVLFVGRLSPEKGLRHLLEAAAGLRHHPFNLVIIGLGPMQAEVERLLEQNRLAERVTLKGHVPHADLKSYYQRALFVVLPSIGSEGCPLTGIEAMYNGSPVVAFDVGGIGEWLKHEQTGLMVPRGDIYALRDAMDRLLADRNLARQLGRQGFEYVSTHFTREQHLRDLHRVYEEAAACRKRGAP
jgi:glycosyltransferase involved in cell wall biosynthesis